MLRVQLLDARDMPRTRIDETGVRIEVTFYKEMLNKIPSNIRYYFTIDIDAFDPSIAAGTGTPSHGGFYYYEILELIDGLAKQGNIAGLDLVEVAPDYDITNSTSTLAAQLLMNVIGRILHNNNNK